MLCPLCHSMEVGQIGPNQFYCWNCFVEYNDRNEVFYVREDGFLESIVMPEVNSDSVAQ